MRLLNESALNRNGKFDHTRRACIHAGYLALA